MKPTRGRDANSIPNGTLPLQHCAANNFSTSFLESKKVRSTGFQEKNGITRLLSQTHWLVALTRFVHPATRRLRLSLFVAWPNASGPMNFSARASPATRVSRRVCLRESLHRDLRAMRQVSKQNDWTAPTRIDALCTDRPLRLHRQSITEKVRGSRDEKPRVENFPLVLVS